MKSAIKKCAGNGVPAQETSQRMIQEHEILQLIDKDCQMFIQSLLSPDAPNNLLVKIARRYQQKVIAL